MAKPPAEVVSVDVSTPEMSLEESANVLMGVINANRAAVKLYDAVLAALTVKHQIKLLEAKRDAALKPAEDAEARVVAARAEIQTAQTDLAAVRGQVLIAQGDLKALNTTIADTRKAWATEDTDRNAAQQLALAELDRLRLEAEARLEAVKGEIAKVVAPYATAPQA